jgi:hypothetical protein
MVSLPSTAARAEECLAGPKGPAPQGSHWYYRVDRAAKRNCWYVREVGPKAAQSSTAATIASPGAASADPAKPTAVTRLQPSVANARAEYAPGQDGRNPAPTDPTAAAVPSSSVFDTPQRSDPQAADAPRWSQSSRWSDQNEAGVATNDSSGTEVAVDQQTPSGSDRNALAKNSSAPPVQSAVGSIWMLLGALVGALALAGALVGAIVKFGSGPKPAIRRDGNGRPDIWGAAITDSRLSEDSPLAADEPDRGIPPMDWIRVARERHAARDQSDEIEQLLARAPRRPA